MTAAAFLFWSNLCCTLFMTGLIWFVQVVHYPLFASVGSSAFPRYEQLHCFRTGWVVTVPMCVEAGTAFLLPFYGSSGAAALFWAGAVLVVLIWISTAVLQVPAHRALEGGFSAEAHRRLVSTNWIRTWLWTARAILLLAAANAVD